MEKDQQKSILTTVIFFDLFDYPLTELEIWKFLYAPQPKEKISLSDIKKQLPKIAAIRAKDGFYFLKGREEIINIKHSRYSESFNKFKKAMRAAKIFSLLPFIQLIAIGNFIPSNNTKKEGDIDFFIITKKNRVWLTRFILATLSQILGWRPTKKNKKDKICLTFFISEDSLNLQKISLLDDVYLHYWLATLYPLYNMEGVYEKFVAENGWIGKFLPNWTEISPSQKRKITKRRKCFLASFFDFTFLEKLSKKTQLKIMPENLKVMANKDSRVVLNDSMLKFHDQDRRKEYRDRFYKKIKEYKID